MVLLLALGVSRLQAQSPLTLEGLSQRISELARCVSALRRTSATKSEHRALTNKVATLEARLDEIPTATPTPEPPTATPTATATATATATPLPATATPSSDVAFVTTRRRMNIRSGPGTNYAIAGTVGAGTRLAITGKNAAGGWRRVDFHGQHGWIFAPYVDATNGETVEVVGTSAAPATPTPQPTATPLVARSNDDLALYLLEKDNAPTAKLQEQWDAMSQQERDEQVQTGRVMLETTAEYCNMPAADAAQMIDRHGQRLDDAGWSAGQEARARAVLMLMLNSFGEAGNSPEECEAWLTDAVNTQIADQ